MPYKATIAAVMALGLTLSTFGCSNPNTTNGSAPSDEATVQGISHSVTENDSQIKTKDDPVEPLDESNGPYSVEVFLTEPEAEGDKGSATVYITVPQELYDRATEGDETPGLYREVTHGYVLLSPLQRLTIRCLHTGIETYLHASSADDEPQWYRFDMSYIIAPVVVDNSSAQEETSRPGDGVFALVINPYSCELYGKTYDEIPAGAVVVTPPSSMLW